MELLAAIAIVLLLGAVVWFVSAPLGRAQGTRVLAREEGRRADLEAARDAKYQEIRDLEMDRRTGKLSEADWKALDRQLRAEAVDILHELDGLGDSPASITAR